MHHREQDRSATDIAIPETLVRRISTIDASSTNTEQERSLLECSVGLVAVGVKVLQRPVNSRRTEVERLVVKPGCVDRDDSLLINATLGLL